MKRHPVHATVWCTGKTWHYVVAVNGVVVLYDNTNSREKMLDTALARVSTLRHLQIAGHKLKLKPYKGYYPQPRWSEPSA